MATERKKPQAKRNAIKKIAWIIAFTAAIATLAIIGAIIPLKITGDAGKAEQIQLSPLDVLSVNPTPEQLKDAVVYVAQKYGLNQTQLIKTIQCESSFIHSGQYGDKGLAFGVAQFHKSTFDRYCTGDYHSAKDQLNCMAKMWKAGLQSQWTCWQKLFSH